MNGFVLLAIYPTCLDSIHHNFSRLTAALFLALPCLLLWVETFHRCVFTAAASMVFLLIIIIIIVIILILVSLINSVRGSPPGPFSQAAGLPN